MERRTRDETRDEKHHHVSYTPIQSAARKRIDEADRTEGYSGKSIEQLKMQRRKANDYIRGEHHYNTDPYNPEESEYDSDETFVVSDNEAEESCEESGEDEILVDGGSERMENASPSSHDSGNEENEEEESHYMENREGEEDNDECSQVRSPRKRTAAVFTSDTEEEAEQEGPIILSSRKRKTRPRSSVSDDDNTRTSPPLIQLDLRRDGSPHSMALSSGEDSIQENILNAPKKRRRQGSAQRDSGETPVRRSVRVASNVLNREKVKRNLFGTYSKEREQFRERELYRAQLAKRSAVEQPHILEEEDEEDTVPPMEETVNEAPVKSSPPRASKVSDDFCQIGYLCNLANNSIVDVRGKVIEYGDIDTRPERTGSENRIEIREITLQDATGIVDVTLWRDYAYNANITLGAYVELRSLKLKMFKDKPTLSTFFTLIKRYEPPAGFEEELMPVKQSRRTCMFKEIDPQRTYIYTACPDRKCYFSGTRPVDLDDSEHECKKCHARINIADTHVGVAVRVVVQDISTNEEEFATIYTGSVRKLCPTVPIEWGHHHARVDEMRREYKDAIMAMVERKLPRKVTCTENGTGMLVVKC